MVRRVLLAGLAVAALAAAPASAAAAAVAETPVVFVTFDELPTTSLLDRRGDLDGRRFPGFAAFARTSTWFAHTTTVADGTRWAAPVVIGGRYPDRRRIAAWFDYEPNLFTLLERTHRVHAIEPMTRLCPPRLCGRALPGSRRAQARTLTELIPRAKHDAARRSAMARWIQTIRPWRRGKPPLYFIHALMPHHPWVWMPDGRRYALPTPGIPGLFGDNMWRRDQRAVDQGWKRHLLQTGYTDLLLRRLMARLRAVGLWDRALVAFSADHGVSFVPGSSRRSATPRTVGGIAPVPFFLKAPGQRTPQRVDDHVETIDVLPTLAAALGLPQAPEWDGRPVVPGYRPKPRVDLWSTTSVVTFGRHTYSLAYVRREAARVAARQHAKFGTGPLRGPFWANPFTPTHR